MESDRVASGLRRHLFRGYFVSFCLSCFLAVLWWLAFWKLQNKMYILESQYTIYHHINIHTLLLKSIQNIPDHSFFLMNVCTASWANLPPGQGPLALPAALPRELGYQQRTAIGKAIERPKTLRKMSIQIHQTPWVLKCLKWVFNIDPYEAFHKWGYPSIIHVHRIFHDINHPAIGVSRYPHLWKPHIATGRHRGRFMFQPSRGTTASLAASLFSTLWLDG